MTAGTTQPDHADIRLILATQQRLVARTIQCNQIHVRFPREPSF